MSKHSEACCTIPPVIDEGYTPKGKYIELNGVKTYVTGPDSATTAILSVYDIFGFRSQILQGADILAYSDSKHPYQVYMPDFFEGNPAQIEWYPPDTDEKKEKLNSWFSIAAPPKHLPKIKGFLDAAEKTNTNLQSWGIIGYCWGGKMVSLIAGRDTTPFKAAVQSSPALIDPAEAEKVAIPLMILASKEEPVDDLKKYDDNLKVKKHVETFQQVHGWMSARADLKDATVKAEYERGYKLALQFFHNNID